MSVELSVFSKPQIKEEVEDLRELLSQRKIAFLLGAGCSYDAGLPLMPELTEEVLIHTDLGDITKQILSSLQNLYSGASRPTIEDYMSDIVDYLSVAERRNRRGAAETIIEIGEHELSRENLSSALDEIKSAIADVLEGRDPVLVNHQKFVRSVHISLEAGKQSRLIDYFILNYDTLLEDALGFEKINYTDGFAGTVTGWWEPTLYEDTSFAARVQKIHGSIDWCQIEGDTLPRRIRKGVKTDSDQSAVLIYPAAPKFREVQKDPFAQLLGNMRQVLRPGEHEQVALCVCGYSFQDAHINLEIENALYESNEQLTLLAFLEDIDPNGIIADWLENKIINRQILVYTNNKMVSQGQSKEFSDALPWWKFEVLARLLGGER